MRRVVLIAPAAGYRIADWVQAARSLQAELIVASDGAQAIAAAMGDRFLEIDPSRPEWSSRRIVDLADTHPLDAVVPIDETGVVIAALAAADLGLRHNPPDAVAATRNKLQLRHAWQAAGVPQPAFAELPPGRDAAEAGAAVGYPCVVKPVGLSASRGVIRADDPDGLRAAAARARSIALAAGCPADEPLLVDAYLPGAEVAVEALLIDGRLQVLALLDKPDPLEGPFFEERMFITPSRHPMATQGAISGLVAEAAAGIGLREGPLHGEVRLTPEGPRMLELAGRSIGGLCGRALRFGLLGASLETQLLRHALGYPSEITDPTTPASGVMMLPIERRGRLESVEGIAEALRVPGVTSIEMAVQLGDDLVPLPEGDRYLGFVFAAGPAADGVEASLREAVQELRITIR